MRVTRVAVALSLGVGCGEAIPVDTASPDTDVSTEETVVQDPWADECDGASATPDAENPVADPTTGSIAGTVSMTGNPVDGYLPRGSVLVSVYAEYDVYNPSANPPPIASAVWNCADFRDDGTLAYEVHGIEPRPEPYTVLAYLDVNGTHPGEGDTDGCDMVGEPGYGVVSAAGQVAAGVDLALLFSLEKVGYSCE